MKRVKLGDVCMSATSNYAQKDLEGLSGEYPVYGASGFIKNINSYHQENEYIAVVKDGAGIGRTMYLPARSSVIGTLQYILPKDEINARFLYYVIKAKHLERYYTGATIPHIYFKDYCKEEFWLPKKDEQLKIVSILDKLEQNISTKEMQLRKLDEMVKSRFVEFFGDRKFPQVTIGDLVEKRISSAKKDFAQDNIIKYIDIASIDNQKNLMTGYVEYVLSEAPSRAQQHILKDDIVISTVRPNLRNVAITNYEDDNLVASSGFCVLRARKCLPLYLMAIVCSDEFTDSMSKVVTGANYPAIKDSDVMGYKVSLPPIKLQEQFVSFVEQVDKSKVAVQKSLDETQLLFDSLMQKYFG